MPAPISRRRYVPDGDDAGASYQRLPPPGAGTGGSVRGVHSSLRAGRDDDRGGVLPRSPPRVGRDDAGLASHRGDGSRGRGHRRHPARSASQPPRGLPRVGGPRRDADPRGLAATGDRAPGRLPRRLPPPHVPVLPRGHRRQRLAAQPPHRPPLDRLQRDRWLLAARGRPRGGGDRIEHGRGVGVVDHGLHRRGGPRRRRRPPGAAPGTRGRRCRRQG
mgnify:CR=1 FL=1